MIFISEARTLRKYFIKICISKKISSLFCNGSLYSMSKFLSINARKESCHQNIPQQFPAICWDKVKEDKLFYIKISLDLFSEQYNCHSFHEALSFVEDHKEDMNAKICCQGIMKLAYLKQKFIHHKVQEHHQPYVQANKHFFLDIGNEVRESSTFLFLLNYICKNVDSLSFEECASLLLGLKEYDINMEQEVMYKLLLKVLSSQNHASLSSAVKLSFVFKSSQLNDLLIMAPFVNYIGKNIGSYKSFSELTYLFAFLANSSNLFTVSVSEKFKASCNELLADQNEEFDFKHRILLLNAIVANNSWFKNFAIGSLSVKIGSSLEDFIPSFSIEDILFLFTFVRFLKLPRKLIYTLLDQTKELLKHCKNDLSKLYLICCIKSFKDYSCLNELKTCDPSYYPYLMNQNYSGTIAFLKTTKPSELVPTIVEALLNPNCLLDLYEMILITELCIFVSHDMTNEITNLLISTIACKLSSGCLLTDHIVLFVSCYIALTSPDDQLYKFIERYLKNLTVDHHYILSKALGICKYSIKYKKPSILKINSMLNDHMKTLLKENLDPRQITKLAHSYQFRNELFSSSVLDLFVSHLESRLIHPPTESTLCYISLLLTQTQFNSPMILQSFADYYVRRLDYFSVYALNRLTFSIFYFGFYPKQIDQVTKLTAQVLDENFDNLKPELVIRIAIFLGFYKGLTHSLIKKLFDIDFLEKISKDPNERTVKHLLHLNRIICIEYPEERIPWFHENYLLFRKNKGYSAMKRSLFTDVHQNLANLLGGTEFIGSNCEAPYCYELDLEVIFKNGIPVNHADFQSKKTLNAPSFFQFAFLLQCFYDYSINNKTPNGYQQIMRRHLEILGFVVVEILQTDWYSMTDKLEKQRFLQRIILKELSSAISLPKN